jgi:CheY-like chemotaxis protein
MAVTVLVAEDDRVIRELLRAALELDGYAVVTVRDGAEALSALRGAHEPWVALVDLMMPHVTGWQVCAEAARDPDLRWHRLVVVSAALTPGDPPPFGACAALCKPFSLDAMESIVRYAAALCDPTPHAPVPHGAAA